MKLNGPAKLSLLATWNPSVVFAGTVAFHDMVVQTVVPGTGGLESLIDEKKSPDGPKVVTIYVMKPMSVVCAAHVPPLSPEVTRAPGA